MAGTHEHRGRLQAQGRDIPTDGGNVSRNWAQPEPLPAADGHAKLDEIEASLTEDARTIRSVGFRMTRHFIEAARATGGVGPTSRSYPKRRKNEPADARVDVEIHRGWAFV